MNKYLPKIPFKRKPKQKVYVYQGKDFKYWKRYEEREKASVDHVEIFHKPLVGFKTAGRKPWQWFYSEYDPVDKFGKMFNIRKTNNPLTEPLKEWNYFVGDHVEVLVGKDKGKIGLVTKVVKERNWLFVAALNKKKVPNENYEMREAPLTVNHEAKLIDPSDLKQTEIEWRYTEDGERVRVSTRTGRIIPLSNKALTTWEDGVNSSTYTESTKDTSINALKEETFSPVNATFEEVILKKYGAYEPKKKRQTYWY